jgi:hypothetical protein
VPRAQICLQDILAALKQLDGPRGEIQRFWALRRAKGLNRGRQSARGEDDAPKKFWGRS